MNSIQVLDTLFVILAQPQWVGKGVICGHDGSWLTGVLKAQDVPKLMGSNLEKVCACGGGRQASKDAKPHLVHMMSADSFGICFDLLADGRDFAT